MKSTMTDNGDIIGGPFVRDGEMLKTSEGMILLKPDAIWTDLYILHMTAIMKQLKATSAQAMMEGVGMDEATQVADLIHLVADKRQGM